MMKIKSLILAMLTIMAGLSFTACSDDDDDNKSNYQIYQEAVSSKVKAQKKHNKAILLVAFGSTWQQAYDAFDGTIDAYKQQFPDYDVFLSFSSAICINRAAAGENVESRNFYAPNFWLAAFAADGVKYNEIVVQSLQVIPGEEYTRVINYIKDFANNHNGDLDDAYLSNVKLKLGVPLLQDAEDDVNAVAKELNALYKDKAANSVVAFMTSRPMFLSVCRRLVSRAVPFIATLLCLSTVIMVTTIWLVMMMLGTRKRALKQMTRVRLKIPAGRNSSLTTAILATTQL